MNHHAGRKRKVWAVATGLLALFVGVLIACEVAGWPFLAAPVQRALSNTLQREVQLNDAGGAERATVRFVGGLKVKVPQLVIAAPQWSKRPFFLQATQAEMHLSYGDLWRARRGAPLDIDLLQAERLVVHAERLLDGRASWVFGDPAKQKTATDQRALQLPTVGELRVLQGELSFVDAPLKANITAELQLAEGTLAPSGPLPAAVQGLIASARGTYGQAKLTASLRTAGVTPLLRSDAQAQAVPVVLELKAGKAALTFDGTVTDLFKLANMKGAFRVSGPSLAAAGDPLGVTLPTTGAFVLAGRIVKNGGVWNVVTDDATVGSSKLTGAMTYDTRPAVPMLSGRVSGPKLLLADLAPTIGGEPDAAPAPPASASSPRSARVLPDKEFDLPSLRAMNANVLMSFDRVELGSLFALPLQPLKTHLTLQDGTLRLSDLVARTADGNLAGTVVLDGTGKLALWRADLRWSGVKLEEWLKQKRAGGGPPYVSGSLVGRASLKGQGRSTAQILGSLDGTITTSLRNGRVSHLAIEAAGIDIAEALGVLIKGDDLLPVSCGLADMQATQGVLRPRALVVDTSDSTVWADGSVSLKDETLDLRAVVTPKDFSPLALRTPLIVKGPFKDPRISVEKGPLARKLAGAVLLALLNPLAALVPLVDTGGAEEGGDTCAQLLARARQAARDKAQQPARKP
ncbi:MAG: AsmA family protein [Cytophagales bacterium]|nr:AsmA family protein [Rhizobacter sp.]